MYNVVHATRQPGTTARYITRVHSSLPTANTTNQNITADKRQTNRRTDRQTERSTKRERDSDGELIRHDSHLDNAITGVDSSPGSSAV